MRELLALVLTGVALALVGLVVRSRRGARALPPPPVRAEDSSAATESTPPSSDGAKSVALSPRELRLRKIEERDETGLCLYCGETASRQVPQVRLVLPWFDRLYRKFNRVPNNEWEIDVHPDVRFPHRLCEQHQPMARGYLEGYIAEEQSSYARFVEKQRLAMYEFVSHGLDEKMLNDANTIRGLDESKRGKRAKKEPAANDTGVPLRSVGGGKKEAAA